MPFHYDSQPLDHHPGDPTDPHPMDQWEADYALLEKANAQLEEDQAYAEILEYNAEIAEACLSHFKEMGDQLRLDLGLEPSEANIAECYRLATEDDLGELQHRIATRYRNGLGIRQSYEDAAYWYMRAGYVSDAYAMRNLAMPHEITTLAPGNAGHQSR